MKTPERWQEVKKILHSALEMDATGRSAFLEEKCGGDPQLRREVESLIAAHGQAGDRFEAPAIEVVAAAAAASDGHGMLGRSLSHYRIAEMLGSGGMGDVYLADDGQLGRKVALKLLPELFTQDAERVRRFQLEARAASALNHPNILTIHEIGYDDPIHYIATEYVQGETLRGLVGRGPLKLEQALDISVQAAGALAAAHEAGIVHRDIKPENIMLRRDGIVKVLDFGLAKLTERPGTEAEASTMVNTAEGVVIGTAQYMSPEQARGLAVDARTDIWSLGCVIYEMLSGRAPFSGATTSDVIVAILDREPPPLTRVAADLPAELDWLVKKALRKDRDERFQTSKELLSDLRTLKRRFEFESELERTSPPDRDSSEMLVRDSERQTAAATVPVVHPTLSVEYIASGVRKHKLAAVLVLAAIATAATFAGYYYGNRPDTLTEKDTVLLTEFVNTTGDPVFDGTLKQALAVQLGQTPFLDIFPESRVAQALRYMERAPDERVSKEIGREICQREGLEALITGSIASLGNNYVITVEALNGQTGETLALEQVEAGSKEQVINKLGDAATKLREKLGESLSTIQKFDAPIHRATTSSLDALKAYVIGQELGRQGKHADGIPHLKRAIELDPNFAMAHAALAIMHINEEDPMGLAREHAAKAFELRDRVTERERFRIVEIYHSIVTDDIDKQIEVLEMSNRTYPRRASTMNNLALAWASVAQYEKSIELENEALKIDPNMAVAYSNLGWQNMALGRFDEAEAAFEQAYARDLQFHRLHSNHYLVAFAQDDEAEMQRQLAWASGKPIEFTFKEWKSWGEMFQGRAREARETAHWASESAQSKGFKRDPARILSNFSAQSALVGDCEQSRAETADALSASRNRDPEPLAVLGPALCGDAMRTQALNDALARRWPSSTQINAIWGPVSLAALETSKGNPAEAIRILEKARRYEMGWLAGYWPTYVRAQAYLRQGAATEAMVEFQKIIDRRGVWPVAVHYPLAHLGFARAAALARDYAQSRKAYQDFFDLWREADPDIPILQEARKEFEKLATN